MTTTTQPRKPTRLGNVDPLPPNLLPLATDRVRDESQAFAAALERRTAARGEVIKAREAAEAAGNEDRHAAAGAELDGAKLPKAKLPAAEQALAEAQRRVDAAHDAAQSLQNSYLAALRDDIEALKHNATAEMEGAAEDVAAHIVAVEDALIRRSTARKLLAELGDDGEYLRGRSAVFRFGTSRRRKRDPLSGPIRKQLDALRASLGVGEDDQDGEQQYRSAAWQ